MAKLKYCVSLHRGQMHGPLSAGNGTELLDTYFLTVWNRMFGMMSEVSMMMSSDYKEQMHLIMALLVHQ